MTDPDPLLTTTPVSNKDVPILVAPELPDASYGYALPGRRMAQVAVMSVALAVFGIIAACLPQGQAGVVPLCLSVVPLFAVAFAAALPLSARPPGPVA